MKYCRKCGAELTEGVSFCEKCGHPVGQIPKQENGKKNGIIAGGIGVIVLAVLLVALLSAKGILGNKPNKDRIDNKNNIVQKENLVKYFDDLLFMTENEMLDKYKDKIINKSNYLNSDISYYMKHAIKDELSEDGAPEDVNYIDYRLPGFEGDMLLTPQETGNGEEWAWGNILPNGKTIDDYKDIYNALVEDFTEKYGEPYVENYDEYHQNKYNVMRQGYIAGTYMVGWEKGYDSNSDCDVYGIAVTYTKSDDETYVGDGNSDTSGDEDEYNDDDEYDDENEYEYDEEDEDENW